MATGYTVAIADGISFGKFAMNCARAFGYLVAMRDDPFDAPIPDEFKPTGYHAERLEELNEQLAELRSMSLKDASRTSREEFNAAVKEREESIRKNNDLKQKYDAMLAAVERWQPPTTEHQGLKDFMIRQITESIRFDCSSDDRKIVMLTGRE
jgi:hypothetical protein